MATDSLSVLKILDQLNGISTESRSAARNRTRGLPDASARLQLAETYLKVQHRLWPEFVQLGVLPPFKQETIRAMADEFRTTFETADSMQFSDTRGKKLYGYCGTGYLRYSDANSNTRSLDQQLLNILEKRLERRTSSFPGSTCLPMPPSPGRQRRGYQLAPRVMESETSGANALLIDELGRATRDHIEALQLGKRVIDHGKRMIGVTDGFDSAEPFSKRQLTIYGMINEMFSEQLRARVMRGMKDAFSQGKNIGKPSLGYTLVPVYKEDGSIRLDDENGGIPPVQDIMPASVVEAHLFRAVDPGRELGEPLPEVPGAVAPVPNGRRLCVLVAHPFAPLGTTDCRAEDGIVEKRPSHPGLTVRPTRNGRK